MANSIRIHPTISLVAHQHLEAAIARGETLSGIINRLLINQLPKPNGVTSTTSQNKKLPVSTLRANLKAVRDKIATKHEEKENIERRAGTITPEQQDDLYALYEKAERIKHHLGELMDTTPEQVMRAHYRRELDRLEADYEYDTIAFEAGTMTEEGEKIYHETAKRITTLKDRLK